MHSIIFHKLFSRSLILYNNNSLVLRNHSHSALREANLPRCVRVVEVGPRDGLQNEPTIIPTAAKLELINRLTLAGLQTIETTSFVSSKWVPQMHDNSILMKSLKKVSGVSYPVLVPNMKGLEAALNAGAEEIAVFSAASEEFCQRNTNCSIAESLQRLEVVARSALRHNVKVRGYVSCVVGCPYQGYISPDQVLPLVDALLAAGCYEVSLGDTIGVGTPGHFKNLLTFITKSVSPDVLAIHCHDTYGQALANILTSLHFGVSTVDSSIGGLGGCPYAAGATGNVATEDVVYMLQGMGVKTGIDLNALVQTSQWISTVIKKPTNSKVSLSFKA